MSHPDKPTGKLYIFLGAAPGVGKTWAMVDAAQQVRADGAAVVVGNVDTHDRPEFTALIAGLEVIPFQEIEYRSVRLKELDVDAIIQRRPDIVLIDDLAHSNAPGSRHEKRYQDVIELLQSGINVYTTMNVQHISSVAEAVEEITGFKVREQVPDFVLEMATSVRLIDLAPDELLKRLAKRLAEGQRQPVATGMPGGVDNTDSFFKPNTLVTLRELALRVAASRVDEEAHAMGIEIEQAHIEPWASSSKILIGISASPHNERLIRATRHLVNELHTTWLAVYVETPLDAKLEDIERARIQRHLQLAKELGAETLTVAGTNVAEQLVEVAKQYNVARIVVGRSKRLRGPLRFRNSLAEDIMELSPTIDVLVLSGRPPAPPEGTHG
ncbi:MAG: universal stress protein [Anaerolineae bacterium]|nr:universal stress protein [Anaerolineae bacterium]